MQFFERVSLTWTYEGKGFRNCALKWYAVLREGFNNMDIYKGKGFRN